MKVIQIHRYGKPEELTLVDLPIPSIQHKQLLIQNHVASINPYDCMVRSGSMWFMEGFRFPKVLGSEAAGVVVKVGSGIRNFNVGDRVIVFTGRRNAYAEFLAVGEENVTALPDSISYSEGAALPVAGCTAYDVLNILGHVKPRQRILVYGAYGSVGSFAIQLAKNIGASVVGVTSTANVDVVRGLGADHVVDYTTADFRALPFKYDLIFDTPSALKYDDVKYMLTSPGMYVATLPSPIRVLQQLFSTTNHRKAKVIFANPTVAKIKYLTKMIADHKLKVILDREYPIEEMIEAHKYCETKRAKGKITVRF